MGERERIAIFIDGGNFYHRLKEASLPAGTRFSYLRPVAFLRRDRTVVAKRYYIGIVRNHDHTDRSQRLVEQQQRSLSKLEGEGFGVERGRIEYDHKIREMGVDVKIAVDLLLGAVDDRYRTAVLVSSDTDLIPVIKLHLERGKRVEYVGFSRKPSLGLVAESTETILLRPEDLASLSVVDRETKVA